MVKAEKEFQEIRRELLKLRNSFKPFVEEFIFGIIKLHKKYSLIGGIPSESVIVKYKDNKYEFNYLIKKK